jgi:hypothetical protein
LKCDTDFFLTPQPARQIVATPLTYATAHSHLQLQIKETIMDTLLDLGDVLVETKVKLGVAGDHTTSHSV